MSRLNHPISAYMVGVACTVVVQGMGCEGRRTAAWDLVPSLFLVLVSNLDWGDPFHNKSNTLDLIFLI